MKLKDVLCMCSYPIVVDVCTHESSWTYGLMNGDDKRLEGLKDHEVCYITTDAEGNLTIEVED